MGAQAPWAVAYWPSGQGTQRAGPLVSSQASWLAKQVATSDAQAPEEAPPQPERSAIELRRKTCVRMSDLEGLKLILPSRIHELRLIIDTVCKRRGVLLRPDLELDSLDAVKAMLMKRSLHYFTILPTQSVRKEVERRQFSQYAIDDPDMLRTISIVIPPKPRNQAVTIYLQRHIEERASAIKSRIATVF